MLIRSHHPRLLSVAFACAGLAACHDSSEDREATVRSSLGIVVTTPDGIRFEGSPMHIQVSEGLELPAQATLAAQAPDGRTWGATLGLALSQVRRGTISLVRRPLAAGIGMIGLDDPRGELQDFDGGTLAFALLGDHAVDGQATTSPPDGSATFTGSFVVTCWVRPQTLAQPTDGEGDGEVRVEDAAFSSAFCRQFADLR